MKFFFTLLSIFIVTIAVATTPGEKPTGQPGSATWASSTFEQKVFIENKGQFSCPNIPVNEKTNDVNGILFGASSGGLELFFTASGLTYQYYEAVPMSAEEKAILAKAHPESYIDESGKRKMMKRVPHFLSIEWVNANPNVEVISEEQVSFYYTYSGIASDKANAYKKIIYKNLYPNIDAEYFFPADKGGIKYSLILHPGADPSVIKIKYNNASAVAPDPQGNIVIQNSLGAFIDHAPETFYADNHEIIPSAFSVKDNVVSFSLPSSFQNIKITRPIVIDPWLSNPTFSGYNAAYDVNYDASGNVYVYGSYNPFKLSKFNSLGVLQWTYNAIPNFGRFLGVDNYGDFAVDEINGTCYLVEGIRIPNGSRVIKVNSAGMPVDTLAGSPNFQEMWRVEYNRCIGKIVIAGGGHQGTSQGAILDTSFTSISPINVLSDTENFHDMALLAIDNTSNSCYMATARSESRPANYNNVLVKCPIPGLIPITFSVPTHHKIIEVKSIKYINNITSPIYPANGFNGMAVSPSWLYTYNSDTLNRWDKTTGALIASIKASPAIPSYHPTLGGIQISWAGLSVDECDNIYVGVLDSIKVYNSSLTLVNTIALPDTVYDVKLGGNGKLYACGDGFVTEINVPQNTITATIGQTPTLCGTCDGSATVNTISCGSVSGFAYSWSTNPVQTTQTATGLCSGSYSVTLTSNCFFNITTTVTVNTVPPVPVSVSPDDTILIGNNSAIIITGAASYSWSPSTGLSCNTCANPIATPTVTTAYTVAYVDANGCTGEYTVTIYVIDEKLVIPNVFTPNGIGFNETFFIFSKGYNAYHLQIFNRWGQKVFETNSSTIHWNGRIMQTGEEASEGTYFYVLNLVDFKGRDANHKGFLTLLR